MNPTQENKFKLLEETMEEMEKRNFTVKEAEKFPDWLKQRIKENGERFEGRKPFTVYKED